MLLSYLIGLIDPVAWLVCIAVFIHWRKRSAVIASALAWKFVLFCSLLYLARTAGTPLVELTGFASPGSTLSSFFISGLILSLLIDWLGDKASKFWDGAESRRKIILWIAWSGAAIIIAICAYNYLSIIQAGSSATLGQEERLNMADPPTRQGSATTQAVDLLDPADFPDQPGEEWQDKLPTKGNHSIPHHKQSEIKKLLKLLDQYSKETQLVYNEYEAELKTANYAFFKNNNNLKLCNPAESKYLSKQVMQVVERYRLLNLDMIAVRFPKALRSLDVSDASRHKLLATYERLLPLAIEAYSEMWEAEKMVVRCWCDFFEFLVETRSNWAYVNEEFMFNNESDLKKFKFIEKRIAQALKQRADCKERLNKEIPQPARSLSLALE